MQARAAAATWAHRLAEALLHAIVGDAWGEGVLLADAILLQQVNAGGGGGGSSYHCQRCGCTRLFETCGSRGKLKRTLFCRL